MTDLTSKQRWTNGDCEDADFRMPKRRWDADMEERQKRVRLELAPSSWKDRLASGKLLVE